MRIFKRIIYIFIIIVLTMSMIVGCGKQKESVPNDMVTSEYDSEPAAKEDSDTGYGSDSLLEPDKVITTIDLRFETTEFDTSNEELDKIIKKHEGYVEYSNISYSSRNYRTGQYVIRVPKANTQNFKTDLKNIGNKTNESLNKQDVTKQYTDTESRLKVIEVKEERILALMEKADRIEDIIALEEQLSQIIYEKERLQSSLMDLDDKVDFSTVNLYIREVDKLISATTPKTTFGNKISDALNDSLYFFKNTLEKLIILLIYLLPFIIIFGALGFVLYKGIVKYKKKKDN
ncbi:DUF4349 domain-containing protein [Clostridium sp. Cult2]|uniref:DUF4349 domain-containing protein n=1 Tax=Clostridium sp. Cult2 TaxID=2079003 RepID=UPI001F23ACA9|nr:DUF4349 domain-containing protein [Clostridium sp. Cult2]MCF6466767.1 hypothetical protein [Clostridium sp. Cult2]